MNILKYFAGNTSNVTTIPSGCGDFFVGGLGIAGVSLFVGCTSVSRVPVITVLTASTAATTATGTPSIRQLDKANGNLVRPPITNQFLPALAAGVPEDPTTFGRQFKDALWS